LSAAAAAITGMADGCRSRREDKEERERGEKKRMRERREKG